MKNKKEKVRYILGAFTLAFASVSNALIIDKGDWTTETTSGLDWLDLTFTDDMSVDEALSTFANDGWQLATEEQFHFMFDQFVGPSGDNAIHGYTGTYAELSPGQERISSYGDNIYHNNLFQSLFGYTFIEDNNSQRDRYASLGLYLREGFTDKVTFGGLYSVEYFDDLQGIDFLESFYDYNTVSASLQDFDDSHIFEGVFLVRASVPEPSIFALMGAGLAGLGFARRRREKH